MTVTVTLDQILAETRLALKAGGIEDFATEARILVMGLLELDRTTLLTQGDRPLAAGDVEHLRTAVKRRLGGEPPYRIIGRRGFYGLELDLNPATLEPRPDTETLVDVVLERLKGRGNAALSILDLGTGSGAICLALIANLPHAHGVGADIAAAALEAAAANAARNGLASRFETLLSHWFDNIDGIFDVIVSNPPYIASAIIPTLSREVREHDPFLALDGGADGLDAYRAIAADAGNHLAAGGLIAVEIGFDQRDSVTAIFTARGLVPAGSHKDLAGRDRVLVFHPGR